MSSENKWEYDGSIKKYPIAPGEVWEQGGNKVAINDIFDGLPAFMKEADLVFIDPPWNLGNANAFVTKAGRTDYKDDFVRFYKKVFERLSEINPEIAYIEIGKEYLAEFMIEAKKLYKYVTCYNSSYYHKKENVCYVIRASRKAKKPKLDGMDEEDIIAWICENEEYSCIGDFVMGRGLVGYYAHKFGRRFVGCELNPNRLAVLLNRIGGEWKISPLHDSPPVLKQLIEYNGRLLDPVSIIGQRMKELTGQGVPVMEARAKIAAHFGVKPLTIHRWTTRQSDFPVKLEMVKKLVAL